MTMVELIQLLKLDGFNLNKFISDNSGIDRNTHQLPPTAKVLIKLDLVEAPLLNEL